MMPKRRKRKKRIPYPVDRGRQLYRAICILEQIKGRGVATFEQIENNLPEWCERTILRDLAVLESLGWVQRETDKYGVRSWRFVAVTMPVEG